MSRADAFIQKEPEGTEIQSRKASHLLLFAASFPATYVLWAVALTTVVSVLISMPSGKQFSLSTLMFTLPSSMLRIIQGYSLLLLILN